MPAHGNGLGCGLYMSGSAACGRRSPRGGTTPTACPAARGCKTPAGGGARPFEEAEATRLLLDLLAGMLGGIPDKKADGRMNRASLKLRADLWQCELIRL
jgi:hypothetical protein